MGRLISPDGSPGFAGAVLVIGCLCVVLGLSGVEFTSPIEFLSGLRESDSKSSSPESRPAEPTHFESFAEARGGVVAMVAHVEGYYFQGRYLSDEDVSIPESDFNAIVRAVTAAEPATEFPAYAPVGSLEVRFADGTSVYLSLFDPIGPFRWRGRMYDGHLGVLHERLLTAARPW
ncbi:MAG: hypothetical protein DWQ34_19405 [Planctomycetota bacterium]|nr:MAG: hypothetical protein DWQ29_15210 [Planctomycetota bacterium]REJ89688.1 MAG: hypothetical protein DWQ34_19405 [Planctomycetota bacterium]REK24399.1 MAG: hypothetical protein DWQ41_15375 [Planctomycetota bacterium]REK38587.1 MAG: hypothetical protein DWQ45_04155 [Planctomycetota bacterium]